MKKLFMVSLILNILGCQNSKSQPKVDKIPLEKIEQMFSDMKANGVNMNSTMLWGYFFTSIKKERFDKVIIELKKKNFDFVGIHKDDDKIYRLHLERKEVHTAKSLYKLDDELYEIAEKHSIIYDGFDVGNVDKNKGIERDTYVVPEYFNVLDYQKDNSLCILVGNIAFDHFPHKEEFRYFIKVEVLYGKETKADLPTNEQLEKLNDLEIVLERTLTQNGIKNYYVFRETHKGVRTFFLVTNNKVGVMEAVRTIQGTADLLPFSYEIIDDKDWNIYQTFRKKLKDK